MIYGYIRVSTEHQTVKNQQYEIENFCSKNNLHVNVWEREIISSKKELKNRKLFSILKKLKKNDILITTELSRLGRNLLEVMGILKLCLDKECQIWTIKENYRLGADIQSKVLAFAFSLASEIERNLISERTKNALQRLKNEGKKLGRPKGKSYKKLSTNHQKIIMMINQNKTKADIARELNCSWCSVHRYIKNQNIL